MQSLALAAFILSVLVFIALSYSGFMGDMLIELVRDDMDFARAEHDEHEAHLGDLSIHERI